MPETLISPPDKPVFIPPPGTPATKSTEGVGPTSSTPAATPPKTSFMDGMKKLNTPAAKPDPAAPEAAGDDAPPEIKSAAGKTDWMKIKERASAAEKRASEFEAKLNTETTTLKEQLAAKEKEIAEARAAFDPAEVARLREEHAALKSELNLADVTKTPEWRQHFVVPIENATKAALDLIPEESKRLAKWYLDQPDSPERTQALEDMMAGMSALRVGKFSNALTAIDSTRERANALLAENQGLVERFQKGRETEAQLRTAKQKQDEDKAFAAVRDRVVAFKMPWDSDPANYDKSASEGIEKARQYFGAQDTDTRARVAHWAAFGEAALPQIKSLQEQLAAEKATVAKLTAAGTKAPGGSGATGGGAAAPAKGGEFLSRVRGG